MITRIRYTADQEGFMVSNRMIPVASGEVKVKYSPDSRVVIILNGNDQVMHTWVSTTNHELKKSIKSKLIEMGGVFSKENRERL